MLILLLLAALGAAFSNLAASRERKLDWIGRYPNALTLPASDAREKSASAATGRSQPGEASAASATKEFPPHPDRAAVEIAPEDAELLYGRKAIFLDARRTKVYEEGHIAGARSFPVWEADIDERVRAFYEEGHDPEAPIVGYCSGGNCEDSHMLAQKLYMVGFDNVLVYKDGFPDWQKRGRPVRKGSTP